MNQCTLQLMLALSSGVGLMEVTLSRTCRLVLVVSFSRLSLACRVRVLLESLGGLL